MRPSRWVSSNYRANDRLHGFLLDRGRFTEIRPRGALGNVSLATDVDDRGRLVGWVL
jgi:hypothetical protein